jgi:diketogulonate reductase-like aldo/keto reductase
MHIPPIGLGTWELRGKECTEIVKEALELGYRHIDTAHSYENHRAIQEGMEGYERGDLFLTSKIALEEEVEKKAITASVEKACSRALRELGTDYLDLYLIHWPYEDFPLEEIYSSLEKLVQQGKAKRVGVSNFGIRFLDRLRKVGLHPSANQVEFHPYLYQKELLDYCLRHHIQLIAYRPFGKGKLLREEPLFKTLGEEYGKTGAQVVLRWLFQMGIPAVPKASSAKHLKENLEIFDFELSAAEMKKIGALHKNKRYCHPEDPAFKE